ncbi:hypothetical protein BJX96DRAFT_180642 [Aspergillus floccosus]
MFRCQTIVTFVLLLWACAVQGKRDYVRRAWRHDRNFHAWALANSTSSSKFMTSPSSTSESSSSTPSITPSTSTGPSVTITAPPGSSVTWETTILTTCFKESCHPSEVATITVSPPETTSTATTITTCFKATCNSNELVTITTEVPCPVIDTVWQTEFQCATGAHQTLGVIETLWTTEINWVTEFATASTC